MTSDWLRCILVILLNIAKLIVAKISYIYCKFSRVCCPSQDGGHRPWKGLPCAWGLVANEKCKPQGGKTATTMKTSCILEILPLVHVEQDELTLSSKTFNNFMISLGQRNAVVC